MYLCEEYLQKIIDNSSLKEQIQYFTRMEKLSRKDVNVGIVDGFFIRIAKHFKGEKLNSKKIRHFQERIKEEEDEEFRYDLVVNVFELYKIYKETKAEDEMFALLETWKNERDIRILYAKTLFERNETNAALDMLYEGESSTENTHAISLFTKEIKDIYKKTGDEEALYKKIVDDQKKYNHVLYDDFIFVKEFKPDEWEQHKNSFIDSLIKDKNYAKVFFEENRIDDLLKLDAETVKAAGEVWDFLKNNYAEVYLKRYEDYILSSFKTSSARYLYRSSARNFKKLIDIPGGKARAEEIAKRLKNQYPNRTAMADEIDKAMKRYFK